MKSNINEYNCEITVEMLDQMADLRVTDGKIEDILNSEKGGKVIGEVLYYLSLDWIKHGINYEQDHLHPFEGFDRAKPYNVSMEEWRNWRNDRNRLPNLNLLTREQNASKSDTPLVFYYAQMDDARKLEFYRQAIIPEDVSLELENFGEFYEARKNLLTEKIRELLG